MNSKTKALRVKHFKEDETEGIKDYKQAISRSKGKEKATYKHILPEEKHHLKLIKNI